MIDKCTEALAKVQSPSVKATLTSSLNGLKAKKSSTLISEFHALYSTIDKAHLDEKQLAELKLKYDALYATFKCPPADAKVKEALDTRVQATDAKAVGDAIVDYGQLIIDLEKAIKDVKPPPGKDENKNEDEDEKGKGNEGKGKGTDGDKDNKKGPLFYVLVVLGALGALAILGGIGLVVYLLKSKKSGNKPSYTEKVSDKEQDIKG